MDKIEKIRQEIERQIEEEKNNLTEETELYYGARQQVRSKLLSFLDTLSEELDKSLEEAAEKYCLGTEMESPYVRRLKCQAFIAGAEWQKQKMLKDAFVDSYVVHDGRIELGGDPLPCLNPIILLPYPQFKPGDKVKVIIVKED